MKQRLHLPIMMFLYLAVMLTGCIEVIDFDTERSGGQLVVDGSVVNGPGPFQLYLGRTANSQRKTIPLEGATVRIFDNEGNSATYVDMSEGQYRIPEQTFSVEIGRTYYLHIELDNGEEYESEREVTPGIYARLDSLNFDFGEIREVNEYGNSIIVPTVNAYVDLSLEQTTPDVFYRFDVDEVYRLSPTDFPDPFGVIPPPCFVYTRPDLSSFTLLNVDANQPRTVSRLQVASARLDNRFDERHYFNVYLRSLTEGAYTFWSQVGQTLSAVGTIFDTPPAPVRGNIYNVNDPGEEVLGYFSAMSSDTIRAFLLPENTPFLPYYQCEYSPAKRDYPPRCLNCLSVPGSSYQKPDYF
ncbi:DUF4249 domain-containing protein [Flavilitoribacter nigricans]|uniref:DUF4249 domain-containing protein n=1 Tax=Flavilitoribacter nigricans (strain ATCC 23147 / DSM 23189 / NBRC 102662 / NCIMB 1420 / SS-2) TaxID=1122177 RepID=A0A2D0N6R7_FLAN2|nr:DUF4249 domain-containing protein [Flavilitoribacter nigricans]PHN03839.1 hypothetical protein CRP01_25165 [Flavilitoribacter nigricans DSM 23189 = NBRC 102662]